MKYKHLAIIILSLLVISTLSLVPLKVTSGVTRTYDFTNRVDNKAYEGSIYTQPPPILDIGSELSSQSYDNISYLDGNLALYSGIYSDFHRFQFKIVESSHDITQIYVEHDGYGNYTDEYVSDLPGLNLFIWDYASSSWQLLAQHDNGTDVTMVNATILSDFYKYVSGSGYLNLLAQAKEHINYSSCPFLYTYDGEKYSFVTDLYNRGVLAVPGFNPQPVDYAKIDSSQLQQTNGRYQMQVTQEYDEISYMDQLSLLVLDHPLGVDVFPSLLMRETGRFYTVNNNPQTPLSAVDANNNDVLNVISSKDGVYTQGIQNELNLLQLNLGDLSGAKQVKLVLTAFTQWDNSKLPKNSSEQNINGRFVQVRDEKGNWVNVYENFDLITPSAMPRTYVLDLTGKFLTNDYSVRMGFYSNVRFDFIGVDTSEQQEIKVSVLQPESADLHYRGYSEMAGVPAIPNYYALRTDAPLSFSQPSGSFTRFGDVLPLLTARDDKFVVMHHGDEISIIFDAPPAAQGSARDFFLYSVGYYKNIERPTGGTVDPLPFSGMSTYPYTGSESYPSDADHQAYLTEYNTRMYPAGEPAPASVSDAVTGEHHTIYTDYVKLEVTSSTPVGGTIIPIDQIELLAPLLAVVAISIIAGAIMVKRLRPGPIGH